MYRVLIVTGVVTDEHDPRVNGMLRRMLESTGKFEVRITEEFKGATAETLEDYDAVLINYDGRKQSTTEYIGLGETAERTICDFAASGKGVIIFHSTMILGEPALPEEFVKMVGGEFNFFNGGRKYPRLTAPIKVLPGDPITEGVPEEWWTVQEDFFTNVKWLEDAPVEVLATVYEDSAAYKEGMQDHLKAMYGDIDFDAVENMNSDHPVIWKNRYGR